MTGALLTSAAAGARRQQLAAMPAVAARWTPTAVDNGRGGQTTTLTAAPWPWPSWAGTRPAVEDLPDGSLPARLARPTDRILAATADQYGTRARWVLTLPEGTPVVEGDVIAVEHPATGLEVVGTIGGIYSDPTTAATATRALLVADAKGRTVEDLP